ncbi:MAG: hypothetical protein AB7S38_18160 [Vulcanimicrobiota bacterium]
MASSSDSLTLEEQLNELREENRGLREQISGPDLSAFEQNRQLKIERKKLQDDVRRLTSECVQLTFQIRELEGKLSDTEGKLQATEGKLRDAEDQLRQAHEEADGYRASIEQHRSQEMMLSQELEDTRTTNADTLKKLEQEREEQLRQLEQEREQERRRLEEEREAALAEAEERMQSEIAQREGQIGELRQRVDEFKEQFLSTELPALDADASIGEGRAFSLLTEHLERLLGYPGRTLVEQVFSLCRADFSTSDPKQLEDVFEALQDTASKLVRSPDQEKELADVLAACWAELGVSEERPARTAEATPTEPEPESVEETPTAPEREVVEEAAVEEDVSEEPVVEEPVVEEPVVEEPVVEEPVVEEPVVEEPVVEEPVAEEPAAEEAESEPEVAEAVAEGAATGAATGEVTFESAVALLHEGQFDQAAAQFETLRSGDGGNEVSVGLMSAQIGAGRVDDAVELGLNLRGQDLGEAEEQFRSVWETTLTTKLKNPDSDLQRKRLLLALAELKLPAEAGLEALDEAEQIPVRLDEDGLLSYYQVVSRVDNEDVTAYLLDYMHSLGDKPELFEHLSKNFSRYPEIAKVAEAVVALAGQSRTGAQEAEEAAGELLAPQYATREMAEEIGDPGEEAMVEVFLDHLIPRAGLELPVPSDEFEEFLHDSEPAAFVGSLRQALRNIDYTVFFEEIEVLSYAGEADFLVESCPEPTPTLLFHSKVENVPPEELRFLVFRRLVQMYRRHAYLEHMARALDDAARCKLVKACIEIHQESEYEISPMLVSRLAEISAQAGEGDDPEVRGQLDALLDKLYADTGSDSFIELGDFLYDNQLAKKWLDPLADQFAASVVGLTTASYATARDMVDDELFSELEAKGLGLLWQDENREQYEELRLRLQRLWLGPLKAASYELEEE